MKSRLTVLTCVALLAAITWARAEDKPADAKPDKKSAGAKIVQPWSKLSSLTDDQKAQIKEIHAKANDEVKVIRDKEKTDIMAVLTDAQKEELKAMEQDKAVKKKESAAADDKPAAEPAAAKE